MDRDSHDTSSWPQDTSAHKGMPRNTPNHPTGSSLGQGSGDHPENSQNPQFSDEEDEDIGDDGEGEDSESDEEKYPHFQDVQKVDRNVEYPKCPVFAKMWLDSHTQNATWPKGVKLSQGRMYCDDKLCVPTSLTKAWVREHHTFTGHVGAKRL